MSKPLKPRRGTTAQHASFIGEAHEVTFDTDKHTLVAHDGLTAGGFPLQRADLQAAKDSSQDAAIDGALTPIATGSTVARTLADRFAEVTNVCDFGAKGDGVTDDTAAFELAKSHAKDRAVFVPAGVYKLTKSVAGLFVSDGGAQIVGAVLDMFEFTQESIAKIRTASFEDKLNPGRFFTHTVTSDENAVEGVAVGGGYLYFTLIKSSADDTAVIVKVDMETKAVVASASFTELGHANSMAYVDGSLYVAAYPTHSLVKVSADTLAVEKTYDLGYSCFGIAYDVVREEFAALLGGGPLIRFLDKDFRTLHTVAAPVDVYADSASQGIAYHDGIVFLSLSAASNYKAYVENVSSIVACDRNGKMLKTWRLGGTMGELEDLELHDGNFIMCFNTDFKTVNFWQARVFQDAFHATQELTNEQVGEYAGVMYPGGGTLTLYVDASAKDGGPGTSGRPFKRLKDAFAFIERFPYPHQIQLNLTGDFTEEGAVYLANCRHSIIISGGSIASFGAFCCSYIRLQNVKFTDTLANGQYAINIDQSAVDIRSCTLTGSSGRDAIFSNRGTLYLLTSNMFNIFRSAVSASTSTVWLNAAQTCNSCTQFMSLNASLCHGTSSAIASGLIQKTNSTVLVGENA